MTIHVAVGLPGSGKTTYYKKQAQRKSCLYVDGDSFTDIDELVSHIKAKADGYTHIWVDGLFLSKEIQKQLLVKLRDGYTALVAFDYWVPNREYCAYNDAKRGRAVSAGISIKHMPIDKPPRSSTLGTFMTKKYDGFQKLAERITSCDRLSSNEWSNGGTWVDCWGSEGTIGADTPLEIKDVFTNTWDYKAVKELNSAFNFDVSTLADSHERIFNEVDRGEGDYYGGYEERSAWEVKVVDIVKAICEIKFGISEYNGDQVVELLPELFL